MSFDYRLPLMAGIGQVPVPELALLVHPPTIAEIAFMGETDYFMAVQYLCLEKEYLVQDKTLLADISNFQVLMKVLEQSSDREKKTTLITLLKLLFPDYSAAITKNSIILASSTDSDVLIDTDNFDTLQAALREILCVQNLFQGGNVMYNTVTKLGDEIKEKIMRGRKRVAEQKGSNSGESVLTRYLSILSVARIASLEELSRCNLFQLFDLMDRYIKKVESDVDLDVRLAGGKPDKPVESWMKDLHPQKQ